MEVNGVGEFGKSDWLITLCPSVLTHEKSFVGVRFSREGTKSKENYALLRLCAREIRVNEFPITIDTYMALIYMQEVFQSMQTTCDYTRVFF